MKFECPFCGCKLAFRTGDFGSFLGCTDYPSCKFSLNIDDDASDEEIKEKLKEREKIYEYLEDKHIPMNCNKCNGDGEPTNFFNSIYHYLMKKGYLTEKQHNVIKDRIVEFDKDKENFDYKYPPRDEVTSEEEAILRRNGLW